MQDPASGGEAGLRPVIADSWARCRDAGLDRDHLPLHRIPDADLSLRLEGSADLLTAGRHQLEWITAILTETPHVVYLTDRDGVVLYVTGNAPELLQGTGLEPGFDWAERRMGTNGAGTALVLAEPVAVVLDEHYARAFCGCTCTAAPINGAAGGLVGAVDITTYGDERVEERLALARHAAFGIERELESLHTAQRTAALKALSADLLTSAREPAQALARLPRLLTDHLADWAVLYVVEEATSALRTTVAHHDPAAEIVLRTLWTADHVPAGSPNHPVNEVLRTGEPVLIPHVSAQEVAELSAIDGLIASLCPESYLALPLVAGGRTVAVLLLATATGRRGFGGGDLALGRDIANLAALALDNARVRSVNAHTQRMLQALLDYVPEGITIATAPDVHIVAVSRHGVELTGRGLDELALPAGEAAHAHAWALHHLDGTPATDAELPLTRAVLHGEVSIDEEWLMRRPDGRTLTILANAGPIRDENGHITGGVAAWRDITERKATEAQLRESLEAADRAVRTRDEVIGIVSHDLRNPLNAISMASALLQEPHLADAQRAAQVRVIKRASRHMLRLIRDLLDARRIEQHGLEIETMPISPRALVEEATDQFELLLLERNVSLEVVLPESLPDVRADRGRIMQVLDNLVANAIRYSPAGGTVTLRVSEEPDWLTFSVCDRGHGIPENARTHIFERYWQGVGQAGAAGLGLSICREIVTAHGGRIWLEDSGPEGTTMCFRLPI